MLSFLKKKEAAATSAAPVQRSYQSVSPVRHIANKQDTSMPKTLSEYCEEIQRLEVDLNMKSVELQKIHEKRRAAEKLNAELSQQFTDAMERHDEVNELVSVMETKIEKLRSEIESDSRFESLWNTLNSAKMEAEKLDQEEWKKMAECQSVMQEAQSCISEVEKMKRSIGNWAGKKSVLENEVKELQTSKNELELRIEESQSSINRVFTIVEGLLSKIEATKERSVALGKEKSNLGNELTRVTSEIGSKSSKLSLLESRREEYQRKKDEKMNMYHAVISRMKDNGNQVNEWKKKTDETRSEQKKLENKLKKLHESSKALKASLKSYEKQLQKLESSKLSKEVKEAMKAKRELESSIANGNKQISEAVTLSLNLQSDLSNVSEELHREKTKTIEAKSQMISKTSELNQIMNDPELKRLSSTVADLNAQLNSAKSKRKELEDAEKQFDNRKITSSITQTKQASAKTVIPKAKINKNRILTLD